MEDISRELEREIARTKPKPYNRPKGKNILIVDNFGELKSGNYLKGMVYFFLVVSIVASCGTGGFYWLYSKAEIHNVQLRATVDTLGERVQRLTGEKELLMARLVVTGNVSELETMAAVKEPELPRKEKRQGMIDKNGSDLQTDSFVSDTESGSELFSEQGTERVQEGQAVPVDPEDKLLSEQISENTASVTVENFSLSRGKSRQQVVIRFDLRNTTQNAREISGRIFCVLKPEGTDPSQWEITPKADMTDGIPGPYRKGHYFSISRFKPVQFTVSTVTPPEKFTTASIYIFDETETLLFKTSFKSGIKE